MEKTFQTLNELRSAGVITNYAIGGAFALSFYSEPIVTFDLDVFVFLPEQPAGLVSLNPIYDFLRARGCAENQEHVVIAGTPVQFIVAFNPLIESAVTAAANKTFKQVRIRVFQLEHLMAVMLHTGRPKDFTRLAQILADTPYDKAQFNEILQHHHLQSAWQKFQTRFL